MSTRGIVRVDHAPLDLVEAGITAWHHDASVGSTMDVAHRLAAAGCPGGTVVLADVQSAGRGRGGKHWISRAGDGLWFTLVEREVNVDALQVLSLRLGMAIADALAPWSDEPLWLKWPNDVLLAPASGGRPLLAALGKLAGVLVEARWRDAQVEWVAIGVGINLRPPDISAEQLRAAALRDGSPRAALLAALIPRLRASARRVGDLTEAERASWGARDAMLGQACVAPVEGVVQGVDATGALCVDTGTAVVPCRSGSLVLTPMPGARRDP